MSSGFRNISSCANIGVMLDRRLVGYWSDKHLYVGGMEGADIAFRADGTGWTYWSNAAGGFEILRFLWRQTSRSALTLRVREYAGGTWSLNRGTVTHQLRKQRADDQQIALGYEITAGQNAVGDPATVLQFDKDVIRGSVGNRFALDRTLAASEHDPAYRSARPPGIARRRSDRPVRIRTGARQPVPGSDQPRQPRKET
jgi:hypothetical protein